MQSHTTDSFTKNIEAIVMGVLMFFVSFTFSNIANAEEVVPSDGVSSNQAALMEKLEELKNMRAVLQNLRDENKELADGVIAERKEERKAARQQSLEEFKASIADLSPEEKRNARIAFLAQLRADAEALKADREALREGRRDAFKSEQEVFRASLDGLSPAEKMEALRARLEALLDRAVNRNDMLNEGVDGTGVGPSDDTSDDPVTTCTEGDKEYNEGDTLTSITNPDGTTSTVSDDGVYICTGGIWELGAVVDQTDPDDVQVTCTEGDKEYNEGDTLTSITNADGTTSGVTDGVYVCTSGEWKVQSNTTVTSS